MKLPAGFRPYLLALAAAAACAAPGVQWRPTWNAPHGSFSDELLADYATVRAHLQAGAWEDAYRALVPLAEANGDNLQLAVDLQEVELELLAARSTVDPALALLARELDPADALRRLYARRAETAPTLVNLVLAARLESDALAAENFLDRAALIDPDCAWVQYGRAHSILRQQGRVDRWEAARKALSRAVENDPGHLGARRLEAWMLAQEGTTTEAAYALETWLTVTRGDARVSPNDRVDAEIDLALLWILDDRPERARKLLVGLEGTSVARDRRLTMLAATEQAMGDLFAALDAARRAESAAEGDLLPRVQQALLYEYWLEDPEAADRQWNKVREMASDQAELSGLLEGLRAKVMLERRGRAKK